LGIYRARLAYLHGSDGFRLLSVTNETEDCERAGGLSFGPPRRRASASSA